MSLLKKILNRFYGPDPGAFRDGVGIKSNVHLQLFGPDGKLKDERRVHNLVVDDGLIHIADQMADQGENQMSHMAIGTSTGQGAGDTTLATELDRNALTGGYPSHSGAIVSYQATWAAGDGTGAISEAGILNSASGGDLLCYVDFSVINKGASDVLQIDWDLTFQDDGV